MNVNQVMTRGVECARPGDSIAMAAQRMRELNVGSLPVCGEDNYLKGMITDRDITIRATADCCNPAETTIAEAMTPNIVYCYDDQDVSEAAQIMEEKRIRRLPVLDRDKRLVGIVSLGDLAVKTGDDRAVGETLEQVSEPAAPRR